jgi:NAD(P)H-hydrate epimerase
MAGAPALAARGALRAGAGLVTIAVPACVQDVVAGFLAEATTLGLPDADGALSAGAADALSGALERADAVVVGPGLGRAPGTVTAVRALLEASGKPVVLDADGLHAFRGDLSALASRRAPTVLTPHEGEAAALLAVERRNGGVDRTAWARRIATVARAVCVLKGPGTVVTDGRRVHVATAGGPLLATGGTGDVLSGAIAAFLATGDGTLSFALDAARLAVHVHGAAGDRLARTRGDRGTLASEVADALPAAIRARVRGRRAR